MSTPATSPATLAEKLQRIDRRILWLILLIVVAAPTIVPVTVPNAIMPMSRDLWKTVDACPSNKIILLSSTWSNGTRGENKGQLDALLHHVMSKRIRFGLSSFTPEGSRVALDRIKDLARRYNYVYGTDWVSFGYQPSSTNYIKGINADLIATVKRDAIDKQPLNTLKVMRGISSIDNVHMVVELSASGSHMGWVQFLKPEVNLGFCPTSVMVPEALPYYASGQLKGLLWGAKGAYDYEQLNVENLPPAELAKVGLKPEDLYGTGRRYMGPLSAAFALVILSIAVGNIAMFIGKRQAQKGDA